MHISIELKTLKNEERKKNRLKKHLLDNIKLKRQKNLMSEEL